MNFMRKNLLKALLFLIKLNSKSKRLISRNLYYFNKNLYRVNKNFYCRTLRIAFLN